MFPYLWEESKGDPDENAALAWQVIADKSYLANFRNLFHEADLVVGSPLLAKLRSPI